MTQAQKRVVAVPSMAPGGLDAARSAHFGHADGYTIVEVGGSLASSERFVGNEAHAAGGCLSPVALLTEAGVDTVIVGGIGGRPLAGLLEAGITVHQETTTGTVREAIAAFTSGATAAIDPGHSCGCGGHGHDHAGGHDHCGGHHQH
ncbi:MAG: NifB/NifX family molybdenum-iron cluster-binding protein [Coriobacteriia bacterium]